MTLFFVFTDFTNFSCFMNLFFSIQFNYQSVSFLFFVYYFYLSFFFVFLFFVVLFIFMMCFDHYLFCDFVLPFLLYVITYDFMVCTFLYNTLFPLLSVFTTLSMVFVLVFFNHMYFNNTLSMFSYLFLIVCNRFFYTFFLGVLLFYRFLYFDLYFLFLFYFIFVFLNIFGFFITDIFLFFVFLDFFGLFLDLIVHDFYLYAFQNHVFHFFCF
jgi:hypothetical protein